MEQMLNDPVTIISPKPAPHDSFVGPEFADVHTAVKRNDRKCRCTACGVEKDCAINKLFAHPILGVLMCESCEKFYHCGDFTKDSEGYDEQCRWCGQGGNLLMCDSPNCTYSFCNYCIKRNFSSEIFADILTKDTWKCFSCDKSQLCGLMEECKNFINFTSLRQERHHEPINTNDVSVPESLSETNKQIDSILDPLEKRYNGLNDELYRNKIHQVDKKVTPLTIFRKRDEYIVQRKSLSCDEGDVMMSHDPKTQSDPEFSTKLCKKKHLEGKAGKVRVKIEIHSPNELDPGERTSMDGMEGLENGDGEKQPKACVNTNGYVEAELNTAGSMDGSTDAVRKLDMSDINVNKGNSTATEPKLVRRNIGHRTKANRVGSGPDKANHNSQTKESSTYDHELDEVAEHKSVYSSPKLQKATDLFDQYIKLLSDLILEDCSLNISSTVTVNQSPSQYSRFRAANAVLRNVKSATRDLHAMEKTLRENRTKLATYREIIQMPQSAGKNNSKLNGNKKAKSLLEKFNDLSSPNTKSSSELLETNELSIENDAKLAVDPQVRVKKLNDEEFKKLIAMCAEPRYDSNVSSLMLDSDSSKCHVGLESESTHLSTSDTPKSIDIDDNSDFSNDISLSEDSESDEEDGSTDRPLKRKKIGDDLKLSKKHVNKKKLKIKIGKKDISESSNNDSITSSSLSSDISTCIDSDDDVANNHDQVCESDNTIAKNLLLQILQEDNADEMDSDVENLLCESNKETKKGKKDSRLNEASSKNTTSDGEASIRHPLLSKKWDVSPSSKNSNVERPTAKRKKSVDNNENASKKKKEHPTKFGSHENPESDLTTDSDADVWVGKPRMGMKKAMRSILDSDSDEEVDVKAENKNSDNSPSDDDDAYLELSRKRRRTTKLLPNVDDLGETPTKRGRKNIRKVLDDDETSHSTQEAKVEEIERRKRVEAQKDSDMADVIVIDDENKDDIPNDEAAVKIVKMKLLLSKSPVIEVHPEIVQHLKPHQCEGIRFIWENIVETVEFGNTKRGNGCILSHCMGLGKTLQAIAFLHTILLSEHLPKLQTALVICPFITVNNWIAEFTKWIPKSGGGREQKLLYGSVDPTKTKEDRMALLNSWKTGGGVVIIGYSQFRSLLKGKDCDDTSWERALLDPDILVCDEGHILKNSATALAQLVEKVKTKRRLILTGTPLQNNMIEYHCMVNLVKPRLLGNIKEFKNRFVNPIENGQHVDSTDRDVRIMKKRAHVLHELLSGCVQRKDYTFLKEHLPPKYEYTVKVRLSDLQIRLYEKYLSLKPVGNLKSRKATSLFRDFGKFLLIVCHPRCLVMQNETHKKKTPDCDDDNEEDEEEDSGSSDESVIILSDDSEEIPAVPVIPKPTSLDDIHALSSGKLRLFIKNKSGKHPGRKSRKKLISMATRYLDENFFKTKEFEENMKAKSVSELKALIKQHRGSLVGCSEKSDLVNLLKSLLLKEATSDEEWFEKLIPSQEKLYFATEHGGKIVLMLEILRGAAKLGDKVVIFSQSLITLDCIELILHAESKDASTKSNLPFSKWVRNKDYFRIDGCIRGNERTSVISNFNNPKNPRGRLLLVSTRAGSMGVNLIGANRAIVFDASWNPTNDIQSIFRIYRFGQTKTCYIYRLVAQGTMEEKIYERQVVKRSLSYRVVDEQQIPRHFRAADVAELYTFKPERTKPKDSVPECAPPRDALLASIINSTDLIVSFHEPDTLLDHQVSEELSEAERKAAWEEYNTANPATEQVSSSFKAQLQVMPRHVLMSLCKHGGYMLQLIDQKLLEISEKTPDVMVTEIRMKNRSITAEQVNIEIIRRKFNNHIQIRRLNNLKRVVAWHHDTAQKAYQSQIAAPPTNRGQGGAPSRSSVRGTSGSTMRMNHVGVDPRHVRPPIPNLRIFRPSNPTRFATRSHPFATVNSGFRQTHPTNMGRAYRFHHSFLPRGARQWHNAR